MQHSNDYLKLNLPITSMQQHIGRQNTSSYSDFLPGTDDVNVVQVLVIDALNVYRSASKCLCESGHRELLLPGGDNDFKSFCIFLSLYIPSIIIDHHMGSDDEKLIIDVVCKPSNWTRDYQGSPCDDNNILNDSKFMNITKDEQNMFKVSCLNNYMMCTNSIVQAFIEEQNYREKPIVTFSIALPEQDINPGISDPILIRRKKEIHGIDDILAIKKVFMYRQKYLNSDNRITLITCDTMLTNSMQKINATGGIREERREYISNQTTSDIRYIDVKSPLVDITEVSIGSRTDIYSHSAIDFWDQIENTSFNDVLRTPFEYWNPPNVEVLRCLYDQSNCKKFSIRRTFPVRKSRERDDFRRHFFLSNQLTLDVTMAKELTINNGLIQNNLLSVLIGPLTYPPVDSRKCIQNFQNKSCNMKDLNDFVSILKLYIELTDQQVEKIRRKNNI